MPGDSAIGPELAVLPVVLSEGEIAWVPGVATGERFRATEESGQRVRLDWRRP